MTNDELEKLALAAEDAAGGPPSAEQVDALIEYADALRDALEAATRVPVQGEPNDDRTPEFEAIEQELFKHQPLLSMQDGSIRGCKCMDRVFVTKTEDWGTHLAEVFTRLSRATVPDAATEGDYHEGLEEGIKIGRAERDAALAAVDRVRAILAVPWREGGIPERWHRQLVAALDGAPEPEWEERLAACDKHGTHCWSCKRYTERRRPAGDWHRLPVEGESKP